MIRIRHLVTREAVREPGKGGAENRNLRDEGANGYDIFLDGNMFSVHAKPGGKPSQPTKVPMANVVCFEEHESKAEAKK